MKKISQVLLLTMTLVGSAIASKQMGGENFTHHDKLTNYHVITSGGGVTELPTRTVLIKKASNEEGKLYFGNLEIDLFDPPMSQQVEVQEWGHNGMLLSEDESAFIFETQIVEKPSANLYAWWRYAQDQKAAFNRGEYDRFFANDAMKNHFGRRISTNLFSIEHLMQVQDQHPNGFPKYYQFVETSLLDVESRGFNSYAALTFFFDESPFLTVKLSIVHPRMLVNDLLRQRYYYDTAAVHGVERRNLYTLFNLVIDGGIETPIPYGGGIAIDSSVEGTLTREIFDEFGSQSVIACPSVPAFNSKLDSYAFAKVCESLANVDETVNEVEKSVKKLGSICVARRL